jgi:hypothetical protein
MKKGNPTTTYIVYRNGNSRKGIEYNYLYHLNSGTWLRHSLFHCVPDNDGNLIGTFMALPYARAHNIDRISTNGKTGSKRMECINVVLWNVNQMKFECGIAVYSSE